MKVSECKNVKIDFPHKELLHVIQLLPGCRVKE